MQLPRRTANLRWDELSELFSLLYPQGAHAIAIDENYNNQRREGIERCKIWLNRGSCPYAVESTMNLIESQQLDVQLTPHFEWSIRTSYAMAILRFVNSLADSMQTGLYAQSIFTIAEKIQLPLWFVELRHASTHEELPTLNVLRKASVEALAWLLNHFWLPNIQKRSRPSTESGIVSAPAEDDQQSKIVQEAAIELRKQINNYRTLSKQIANDASLQGPLKASINSTQTRISGCVKKADSVLVRHYKVKPQYSTSTLDDRISGMDILVDVLCSPGGLIPLAARKRIRSDENGNISPIPSLLVDIWISLLGYLSQEFDTFHQALVEMLIDCIIHQEGEKGDQSVIDTAASWLLYIADGTKAGDTQEKNRTNIPFKIRRGSSLENGDGEEHSLSTISIVRKCLAQPTKTSISLSKMLCENNTDLKAKIGHLLEFVDPMEGQLSGISVNQESKTDSGEDDQMTELERSILAMEKQLNELKEEKKGDDDNRVDQKIINVSQRSGKDEKDEKEQIKLKSDRNLYRQQQKEVCALLEGWDVMDESVWRPIPIGCLNHDQIPLKMTDFILTEDDS